MRSLGRALVYAAAVLYGGHYARGRSHPPLCHKGRRRVWEAVVVVVAVMQVFVAVVVAVCCRRGSCCRLRCYIGVIELLSPWTYKMRIFCWIAPGCVFAVVH